MTSVWADSVAAALDDALITLALAVRDTFAGLTDERAATPTPSMPWTPYARVLTGLVAHTNEHAAQILQHLNARP